MVMAKIDRFRLLSRCFPLAHLLWGAGNPGDRQETLAFSWVFELPTPFGEGETYGIGRKRLLSRGFRAGDPLLEKRGSP